MHWNCHRIENEKMKLCDDIVYFCCKVNQSLEEGKDDLGKEVRISNRKLIIYEYKLRKEIVLLLKEKIRFCFRNY